MLPIHLESSLNCESNHQWVISQASLKDRVCTNWKKIYFIAATTMILIGIALSFFFDLPYLALALSALGVTHLIVYYCCGSTSEPKTSKAPPSEQKPKKPPSPPTEPPMEDHSKDIENSEWYDPGEETTPDYVFENLGQKTLRERSEVVRAKIGGINWTRTEPKSSSTSTTASEDTIISETETPQQAPVEQGSASSSEYPDSDFRNLLLKKYQPITSEPPKEPPKEEPKTLE